MSKEELLDLADTNGITLKCNCSNISAEQWLAYMKGAKKIKYAKVVLLIKNHLPWLYNQLSLSLHNPYYSKTFVRQDLGMFILTHSAIEYFISINNFKST